MGLFDFFAAKMYGTAPVSRGDGLLKTIEAIVDGNTEPEMRYTAEGMQPEPESVEPEILESLQESKKKDIEVIMDELSTYTLVRNQTAQLPDMDYQAAVALINQTSLPEYFLKLETKQNIMYGVQFMLKAISEDESMVHHEKYDWAFFQAIQSGLSTEQKEELADWVELYDPGNPLKFDPKKDEEKLLSLFIREILTKYVMDLYSNEYMNKGKKFLTE